MERVLPIRPRVERASCNPPTSTMLSWLKIMMMMMTMMVRMMMTTMSMILVIGHDDLVERASCNPPAYTRLVSNLPCFKI